MKAADDGAEVLARWQAREAELGAVAREYGVATREQVAGKSGLEMFQAMLRGELPGAPIARTLDFILVEA